MFHAFNKKTNQGNFTCVIHYGETPLMTSHWCSKGDSHTCLRDVMMEGVQDGGGRVHGN